MSVFWGCCRINVFGWFNKEHGEHIHEYHVPRTTRIMWGVQLYGLHGLHGLHGSIMWGVNVYGSLYEVHQVYATKSGTLDNLYQFCVFHCLPAIVFGQLAAPGFGPRYLIYMATSLRVPPQSRD